MEKEVFDEMISLLKCDLSTFPSVRFRQLYEKLDWVSFDFAVLKPDDIIIRARVNEDKSFNNIGEISYKPHNLNTKYQRASTPNKTMFYGCFIPSNHFDVEFDNALLATIFELFDIDTFSSTNGIIRKKVTFGVWKVKTYTLLPVIMKLKDFYAGKAQCNFHESRTWLIMPDEKESKMIEAITTFLYHYFTLNVKSECDYLPSSLFTEYLLLKGYKGIYYPGIKSENNTFSVALTPEFVDNGLILDCAVEARVYINNGDYLIETEYTAKPSEGILNYNIGEPDKTFKTKKEITVMFNEFKRKREKTTANTRYSQ